VSEVRLERLSSCRLSRRWPCLFEHPLQRDDGNAQKLPNFDHWNFATSNGLVSGISANAEYLAGLFYIDGLGGHLVTNDDGRVRKRSLHLNLVCVMLTMRIRYISVTNNRQYK
jgi:hypothetical protein